MANYAWPSQCVPSTMQLQLSNYMLQGSSMYGRGEQTHDLMNDRWMLTANIAIKSGDDAGVTESFVNSLRGGANTVSAYHFHRPRPNGTQLATTALSSASAQGAKTFSITSVTGNTVKEGDYLSIDGLLFQVDSDATAVANILTVTTINRARRAFSSGAVVIFNQPSIRFRLTDLATISWQAGSVLSETNLS